MIKIREALETYITPKVIWLFFFCVYVISVIPMFMIGLYNYPSADDYSIGSNARQAWVASHSIVQTVGAAILRAAEDWKIWMGYFTSNFLMALPPCVFGEKWYALTTIIMVVSISLSTGYLLYQIFVRVLKSDKYTARTVICIVLFFMIQCMVGRVEAFYWYCGAANYMLTHSMLICFYGMLISLSMNEHKKIFGISAAVLGFFAGGGNLMSALNGAIILALAVFFWGVKHEAKKKRKTLFAILFFYLGFILNIAAPGNWVRSEISVGMNPIKAILVSLLYGIEYCISEWTDWSIILMLILLIPLLWKVAERTEFKFPYPILVVFFGFGIVSAMMTPPLFAVGNMEAGRLKAVTYMVYILVLVLCQLYTIGWIQKKYFKDKTEAIKTKYSADMLIFLLSCILFCTVSFTLVIAENPHYYTSSSATTDLLNKSAKQYGEELRKRAELYKGEERDIVVEPLTVYPQLLYFSDIEENPEDWQNRGLCRFYGLNSVRKEQKQE